MRAYSLPYFDDAINKLTLNPTYDIQQNAKILFSLVLDFVS